MKQINPDIPQDAVQIERDLYWAMVPEWVIFSSISANAIRMYCVLARRADKNSKQCHPTRATLAKDMRSSRATVDRALEELRELGAITVKQRKSKSGDWTSNVYVVRSIPPVGVSSQVSTPLITGDETGLITGDEQTRVSTVPESLKERSTKSKLDPAARELAASWWNAQDQQPIGKGAWFALLNGVAAALKGGHAPDKITEALDRIGTVPSVAQLDRELRRPSKPRGESNRERSIREALERTKRLAEQERQDAVAAVLGASTKELRA